MIKIQIICDDCGKGFRCSPSSYGWQMYGIILDGYCLCGDCVDPVEYLESIENDPKKALTSILLDKHDPEKYGYKLFKDDFENGLHPGQNDSPDDILKQAILEHPKGKFIFAMTSQGQFDIYFSIYKKV